MIFISILIIIVAIALPSLNKQVSSVILTRITAIVFIYSGALALNALYIQSIGSGIGIFSGLFHVTMISQLFDAFLLILASLILVSWPLITSTYKSKLIDSGYKLSDSSSNILLIKSGSFKVNLIGEYIPRTEYCIIVLFTGLGSSLLISSSDLLSMYISIELQSFGLYILATLYKDNLTSTSSGLKYFLLGALSSCLILLGTGLMYTFTGLTNFESIYSLISVSDNNMEIISGVSLGIMFIFIGFLFKIGAAPFHSWTPDVYDETPSQVTIWLTIIPKIAILVLLLELYTGLSISDIEMTFLSGAEIEMAGVDNILELNSKLNNVSTIFDITYNTSYVLKMLLLISSLFSLIIGTIVGLSATKIKRLFAYSTVSHIGFILLALAINSEQSVDAFLFYILQYSITNLNIFLILLALGFLINNNGIKTYNKGLVISLFDFDIRYISDIKGQFLSNPLLSFSLAISLFSFAGLPPLLGFFSKQFVLYSAIQNGYYFISVIAILVSVISASYYLRIILLLFTEKDTNVNNSNNSSIEQPNLINKKNMLFPSAEFKVLTNVHSFLISTITLLILFFILKPSILLNSTQLLALSLFNS